jgi:hypothetical protein
MTKLLDKAIEKARKLPAERQDTLAAVILEEIAGTRKRTAPRSRLDALVAEAERDIRAGKTTRLEFPRRR